MNKQLLAVFLIAVLLQQNAGAQYYHKDIISIKQANDEMLLYRQQKIREIIIHSFDADGTESKDFICKKKISKDYRIVETITSSPGTATSTLVSTFNHKAQLVQSQDSSEITAATTLYEYDNNDNIKIITAYNHSSDDDFTTALKEVHQYKYNDKGQPLQMLRIKNDKDTVVVDFVIDSIGNIADEIERGIQGRHFYYYYNPKHLLTDIVRYNVVSRALKPDVVFEYNSQGQLTQMVTVEEGSRKSYYDEKDVANYYTWRYFYNDEGLRIIEKCFAKGNKLLGYVEYEYQ